MKKYFNKGLLYAWFNSAKAPIIIGLLVWGIVTYINLQRKIFNLKSQIAQTFTNYCYTENLSSYLILGIIFIAIYYIAQGTNKRNMLMFLSSGPYTKKQIKYNELISILITLIPFIILYLYISIMGYIGNKEFMQIVDGYFSMTLIEIIRIAAIGTLLILFMIIIDSMFSNSVIGFISMISIIPISIMIIITKVLETLRYSGINIDYSISYIIRSLMSGNYSEGYSPSILLNSISMKFISIKQLIAEIITLLIFIFIMLLIFNIIQKKYKIEHSNKIFSSKTDENIIVILISTALGCLGFLLFLQPYIYRMQGRYGEYTPLSGINLVECLGGDILFVSITGFIVYKIIKMLLKNIT
ncbi:MULTISPECIES: hypothetical protein [unclassified Clostridium]|uniref:hypothetical protein n=1 Tax=unclassified Clostridium TaxID=2614128 RepID=UPI000297AB5C|nr:MULTISPECIES: hypothetical protein [unclassified Clostridium]EKQ56396.1 MAG: hypothetical protein A370_01988 [Clostridium sp. Maddingley MBC34-26]